MAALNSEYDFKMPCIIGKDDLINGKMAQVIRNIKVGIGYVTCNVDR